MRRFDFFFCLSIFTLTLLVGACASQQAEHPTPIPISKIEANPTLQPREVCITARFTNLNKKSLMTIGADGLDYDYKAPVSDAQRQTAKMVMEYLMKFEATLDIACRDRLDDGDIKIAVEVTLIMGPEGDLRVAFGQAYDLNGLVAGLSSGRFLNEPQQWQEILAHDVIMSMLSGADKWVAWSRFF